MVDDDATDNLIVYEFLVFLPAGFKCWLKLLGKFACELRKYPSCKLWIREGGGNQPSWDLKVWQDDRMNMFLIGGWQEFAAHYELQVGYAVKLQSRGYGHLSEKIFDDSMCRWSYYPPLEDEFGPSTP
ncbi:B3 domain-containing protein Os03g0212300-like [Lolium perenne]|uniref:B3 domain-containing protein Os03g0212300-like n=1 Tax=Lolium perenne TaxID=4522 RepID=UPI0021F5C25A|nr:B3 domain-containing protein Os03g0212300-like [Lolium perenne]